MRRVVKIQVTMLVLVLAVGGLLLLDSMVKRRAEEALAAAVEGKVPGTTGTTATISSFPFVGRLLVGGDVKAVTVTANETRAGQLPLHDVAVTVHDVKVDTGEAMRGRLRISSVGGGSLDARVTQEDLSARISGVQVLLQPGRATVVGPNGVRGELVTTRGSLSLRVPGRGPVDLPLAKAGLLPCTPEVKILDKALELSCSFTQVPEAMLSAAMGS